MTFVADVRFEQGVGPVWARVHFPEPIKGTMRFDIDENGVAVYSELEVPADQANGKINKDELDALNNAIEEAKTVVGQLPFVTSVE